MNFRNILFVCEAVGVLILIFPIIKIVIKGYIYSIIVEYGFYFLIALTGGGYYLWKRLKA